jgi:hypothetical protein
MTQSCEKWAEKEKVNLKIDYLSTQGNKLYLTIAGGFEARSGHDMCIPGQSRALRTTEWGGGRASPLRRT